MPTLERLQSEPTAEQRSLKTGSYLHDNNVYLAKYIHIFKICNGYRLVTVGVVFCDIRTYRFFISAFEFRECLYYERPPKNKLRLGISSAHPLRCIVVEQNVNYCHQQNSA